MNATPAGEDAVDERDVLALQQYLTVLDDLPQVADDDDDRYVVVSESGEAYLVDLRSGTCTCPDYRFRSERCKHIRRVEFATGEREIPPGVEGVDPDIGRHLENSPVWDALAHQFPIGAVVRDRRDTNGRGSRMRVLRVLDARADEYEIWPGTTVAAYDPTSNPGDRVVEVVFEGDLDRLVPGWREWDAADLPEQLRAYRTEWGVRVRAYAYPSSRLEVVDW